VAFRRPCHEYCLDIRRVEPLREDHAVGENFVSAIEKNVQNISSGFAALRSSYSVAGYPSLYKRVHDLMGMFYGDSEYYRLFSIAILLIRIHNQFVTFRRIHDLNPQGNYMRIILNLAVADV
jgi:hypothetical protein